MRLFALASLAGLAAAAPATVFQQGDAPTCTRSNGRTIVHFTDNMHPSFKCTHTGSTCSCVSNHPTHHKGGCREFDHNGKNLNLNGSSGGCTDAGAYMGTCANGSLLGGDNVAVHAARTQDNHCGACDAGYTLVNKACQPFAGACTNGALTTQASRDQHNHCGSCSNGYVLNNKSCTAWTNCGNNQYQSTSPHGTRNRGCSTCRGSCSANEYEVSSCGNGNGSNRACSSWMHRNLYIKSSDANLYVHANGGSNEGATETLHPCPKGSNHPNCQWSFEPSPTRSGAFYIKTKGANKYMHVWMGNHNGHKITLNSCPKGNNQANCQWYLEQSPTRSGMYYIRSAATSLYLHSSGGTHTGATQTLDSCPKGNNYSHCQWALQRW